MVGLGLAVRSTVASECSQICEDVSQGLAARVGSAPLRPCPGPGASSEPSGSSSLPRSRSGLAVGGRSDSEGQVNHFVQLWPRRGQPQRELGKQTSHHCT